MRKKKITKYNKIIKKKKRITKIKKKKKKKERIPRFPACVCRGNVDVRVLE